MKLFFSLFITLSAYAQTPYIVVSYKKEDSSYARKVRTVFEKHFKLPAVTYRFNQIKDKCDPAIDAKAAHLCLVKDDFKFISRNNDVLKNTLGIFWQ